MNQRTFIGLLLIILNISIIAKSISAGLIKSEKKAKYKGELYSKYKYGDVAEDFIRECEGGRDIHVQKNDRYKLFVIRRLKDLSLLDQKIFAPFVNINKEFNGKVNMVYICPGSGNNSLNKMIVEEGNINNYFISIVPDSQINEIFGIPDCNCGYNLILDEANTVVYSAFLGGDELLTGILKKEFDKKRQGE